MNAIVEQMKSEIESLTKERDEFKAAYFSAEKCASDLSKGCAKLQTERDKLKAAAKLALDAMHSVNYAVANGAITADVHVFLRGMSALRQAGVQ